MRSEQARSSSAAQSRRCGSGAGAATTASTPSRPQRTDGRDDDGDGATTAAHASPKPRRVRRREHQRMSSPKLINKISKVTRKSKQQYETEIRALRAHIKQMEKYIEGDDKSRRGQQRLEATQRKNVERITRAALNKVRTMRETGRTNSNVEAGGGVKRKRKNDEILWTLLLFNGFCLFCCF